MQHLIRIIYVDIDGTLRDEQKGIPDSAIWALGKCREQGIQIAICTGRNPASIQDDVLALQPDGIISGGGCYILYHGERIYTRYFPYGTVRKILSAAAKWRLALAVETEHKIYMDRDASEFYKNDFRNKLAGSSEGARKALLLQNKIGYEDNFSQLGNSTAKAHKICALGKETAIRSVRGFLGEGAEIVQCREWNGRWYLELLPRGCSKGSAVKLLNWKLGIPKAQAMCFGDSENDIGMMEETGIAVLVGTGHPAVRKHASSVCEPVREDGICKELLRRKLITG